MMKQEKIQFFDKNGQKIYYKKYFKKQNMLLIEKETGQELIPVTGLTKVEKDSIFKLGNLISLPFKIIAACKAIITMKGD